MTAYIIRRLLIGILVLFIVTIMIFIMLRELPGDPIYLYIAQQGVELLTDEEIQDLREEYGLDLPLPVQYANWLNKFLHGDFGTSVVYDMKVAQLVKQALPTTIILSFLSLILSAILGVGFGTISALKRGKYGDTIVTMLANLGVTAPNFWIGIIMMYVLALKLNWLPPYGYTSPFEDFGLFIRQAIMPVTCLAIFPIAALTRQTRSSMLEVINQDFVRTARAKGLTTNVIVVKHMLKNALIPIITLLGMQFRQVFSGVVVIELVFNIPGMGRLAVDALFSRDFGIVQAVALVVAVVTILTNIIVDIAYGLVDPRIRYV